MEMAMTLGATAKLEPSADERRAGSGLIVGAVARAPVSVRTKLLVGFVVIAALLVVVGVLGLVALGKSNARVEQLGTLQKRAADSKVLETDVAQIEDLLLQRVNATPNAGTPLGRGFRIAPSSYDVYDAIIDARLRAFLDDATQLEDAEPALFERVYALYLRLHGMTGAALARDVAGKGNQVGPL